MSPRVVARYGIGLLLIALPLYAIQRPQGPVEPRGDRSISGVVVDDDRRPVPGVTVRALRPTFDSNGAPNLVPIGRASVTDAGGRYGLTYLPRDFYLVSVDSGSTAAPSRRSTPLFSPVYYPGANDWRSAVPVDISDASVFAVDIVVPLKKMLHVNGTIYNAADPEARVSEFFVSSVDDPSTFLVRFPNLARDTRTSFQVEGLPPGTYDLFPVLRRPSQSPRITHVRMTIPRDLQGVTMEILPGIDIQGRVHAHSYEGSTAIDFSKLKIGLLSRKGELVSPAPVTVQPDGSFIISGLPEMDYQLSVTGLPATAYVESAQLNDSDALHSWVTVNRLSQRLQIAVDTAGGEINGTLVDLHRDRFAANAWLVMVPAQRKGNLPAPGFVVVPTDPLGIFVVRGVPPGDYRLLAWQSPNGRPFFNEEFMKGYLGMGDLIHVYRGSRLQAEAIVVDAQ